MHFRLDVGRDARTVLTSGRGASAIARVDSLPAAAGAIAELGPGAPPRGWAPAVWGEGGVFFGKFNARGPLTGKQGAGQASGGSRPARGRVCGGSFGLKKNHRTPPGTEMGQTTDGGAGGGREHTSFQSRLNFNFWSAAGFILFAVLILLLIPTQIEKPFVILGQAQSVLSPVLFPQLTIAILLIVSIWYLVASFRLEEKICSRRWAAKGF